MVAAISGKEEPRRNKPRGTRAQLALGGERGKSGRVLGRGSEAALCESGKVFSFLKIQMNNYILCLLFGI